MKGCIIENHYVLSQNIIDFINEYKNNMWLITDIECYPQNEKVFHCFNQNYCWCNGNDLLEYLKQEKFQWIWGVFSAFPRDIKIEDVLKYEFPYADGYGGFWSNPISIQHPLAEMEVVVWDGLILLAIAQNDRVIENMMKKYLYAEDLEVYNNHKS